MHVGTHMYTQYNRHFLRHPSRNDHKWFVGIDISDESFVCQMKFRLEMAIDTEITLPGLSTV